MSIYRYSADSLVREIAFRHAAEGPPVALISAADNANAEQLAAIQAAIRAQGWDTIPATAEGKDILQVSGFASEDIFSAFLANQNFVSGAAQVSAEASDLIKPQQSGMKKFLQHHSLQVGGILNLIGDVGLLGGGIKTKDPFKITGGGFYTLGGLNAALFGKVKPKQNLREITEGTAVVIKKAAGLPEGSTLAQVDAAWNKDNIGHTGDFLYRRAAPNTLSIYTAGAGAMLGSGIHNYRAGKGAARLYYGLSSLAFKLASLIIPEKSQKDEAGNAQGAGVMDWLREKPLRLFGYGSLVTDTLLGWDAYQSYKRSPKTGDHLWTGVTTVTYLLADFMMAISSKDPANASGKFSAEEQRRVEALAAETIAREPREIRDGLVSQVAEFLAARPEITGNADYLKQSVAQQLEHLKSNPWAARVTASQETQDISRA